MFEPKNAPREGAASGEWLTATVSGVDEDGVTLLLAGQNAPTQKKYLRLASASIAQGDAVLCLRYSGTIIVFDKLV